MASDNETFADGKSEEDNTGADGDYYYDASPKCALDDDSVLPEKCLSVFFQEEVDGGNFAIE